MPAKNTRSSCFCRPLAGTRGISPLQEEWKAVCHAGCLSCWLMPHFTVSCQKLRGSTDVNVILKDRGQEAKKGRKEQQSKQTKNPHQQSKIKEMKIMKKLFPENAEQHHTWFLPEHRVDFRDDFFTSVFYMLVLREPRCQHRERGNMTVMQE